MGKDFDGRLAYGKAAEAFVKKFFIKKGWIVKVDEEYGFMPNNKNKGARLLVLPVNATLDEAETESHEIIAPDMMIRKNGLQKFVEVKRRGDVSTYRNIEVIYVDAIQWYDYSELDFLCQYNNYGDGVILYLCVDDYFGEKAMFYQTVSFLNKNVQYHVKNEYLAFRVSDFVREDYR